jgi:hypothetical protein
MHLTEEDDRLLAWLAQAGDSNGIDVKPSSGQILARCPNAYIASALWRSRQLLLSDQPKRLTLWVGKRLYGDTLLDKKTFYASTTDVTMQQTTTMTSRWALRYPQVFQTMTGIIFVHGTDPEHRFLAINPGITERRLNKPISDTIGQPLRTVDEAIALPKERAIQQAIATGEAAEYTYEYIDHARWQFKGTAILLPDVDEVLVIVEDAANWQADYWRSTVAA